MTTYTTGGAVFPPYTDRRHSGERRAEQQARYDRAMAALRSSEERYLLAARATDAVIWDWDIASGATVWSEGMERVLGYATDGNCSRSSWWRERIHPDDRERVVAGIEKLIGTTNPGHAWHESYRFRCFDGHYATIVDRGYVASDTEGRAIRMIGVMEDDTEREQLAERLRQAQKMEAVGQLAGGIAHDFNNLLTVITANLEFAQAAVGPEHAARTDLEEIARAAQRARDLVKQLLAFSRKQAVTPELLDLSVVVQGAQSLLRRVIGEEIVLDVHLADDLPLILADKGQLEQVLLNLAVNARDAMLTPSFGTPGRGGLLQIETSHVVLGAADIVRLPDAKVGSVVRLRVRDTGHGMDEATRMHAFEPFYTTKEVGAGTGLGLATVFGVVQQAGGTIHLETSPGMGTVFSLFFPVVAPPSANGLADMRPSPKTPPQGPPDGTLPTAAPPADITAPSPTPVPSAPQAPVASLDGDHAAEKITLLLVEDEDAVRGALRRMLERAGYSVIEARHGADALQRWHEMPTVIDAVITDVRMPEMGGPELVRLLRRSAPNIPVVYMSGYSKEELRNGEDPQTAFISKPFSREQLIEAIRMVMVPLPAL